LLPAWATSSFTTVAGQGWLAGPKPSLDAIGDVATLGFSIKHQELDNVSVGDLALGRRPVVLALTAASSLTSTAMVNL
jgi:hypothetical protein